MAVIAVWQCDRDGRMFEDKKLAEEHDKFLELAANITQLIESQIPDIDEKHSEAIGLLLAQRRESLAKACKGKPEELLLPFVLQDDFSDAQMSAKPASVMQLNASEKNQKTSGSAAK